MYPQGSCVSVPTDLEDPTSWVDFEHWTTTNKYLLAELCHSCELQSTFRQSVSCSLYLQSRCVSVPTGDPMSWWILNTGGVTTTNKYLLADLCRSCEFIAQ